MAKWVSRRLCAGWVAAVSAFVVTAAALAADPHPPKLRTENVVLIVPDGVRWQEVFTGAEKSLLSDATGDNWMPEKMLLERFWRDDVAERRQLLFPFIWGTIAKQGQIFGNKTVGSSAHVTNPMWFSYPGYNEILTGVGDPRIDSNEYGPNPNTTVFEWLNDQRDLRGKVAVYATWGEFHDIFNVGRSHLTVQAGSQPPKSGRLTPRDELLNELFRTTTALEEDDPYNSLVHVAARDYIKSQKPRVLFIGYGETDSWAHSGRYDQLLLSSRQVDAFVAELWNTMQSMPQYRGKTTFIITTDHGRGSGPVDWKDHGTEQAGSDDIWIAVIGPDTPALGERHDIAPVTQSQIAATLAALLGKDFRKAFPQAGAPLPDVLPQTAATGGSAVP